MLAMALQEHARVPLQERCQVLHPLGSVRRFLLDLQGVSLSVPNCVCYASACMSWLGHVHAPTPHCGHLAAKGGGHAQRRVVRETGRQLVDRCWVQTLTGRRHGNC